jgi:hypothetical protein
MAEVAADKRPRLADWSARIQERPAVKEVYDIVDPDGGS